MLAGKFPVCNLSVFILLTNGFSLSHWIIFARMTLELLLIVLVAIWTLMAPQVITYVRYRAAVFTHSRACNNNNACFLTILLSSYTNMFAFDVE